MAEQPPSVQFDDVPLDEARRMGRGPRMEPMLYDTLRQKLQALSTDATRIHLGLEITPQRMKRYLQAIAHELNIPTTVRRIPGGLIFWRSSEEDLQQAQEAGVRLQTVRQSGKTAQQQPARPSGRRRG